MLVFLDTEFTDFLDCELISIGMVSEDGQRVLYLEVSDFDQPKCSDFVRSDILPLLGQIEGAAVTRAELPIRIRAWFASMPRHIKLACDSQHDRDLLADALEGEGPPNLKGWFDLRPLFESNIYYQAMRRHHTPDRPWHHALHDARAHRAGWMAWMDANKHREL